MHSPRSRLLVSAFLSLGLALLWAGHDPAAGEPKKDEIKNEEKKQDEPKLAPSDALPPVFSKDQPESVDDLKAIEAHVRKEIEKITPAVVGVRIGNAQGSGVIVTKDGYVLTAGHVSGKPDRDAVIILPSGRMVKAKTLGSNGGIDSGMIKIAGDEEWPYVEMGKSEDLKKGSWVLAIGHPGGFRPNRTPVVRLGRVLLTNEFVIRSDCTIVGGDSGGPLFDMHGKVVGIHSRIGGSITENIHVPVKTYVKTWAKLAKGEIWGGLLGQQVAVMSPGGKIVLDKEGKLTAEDPKDKKLQESYAQVHTFRMVPGSAYTIDMSSPKNKKFEPYLRLEDSTGKELAEDGDGGGHLIARIVFRPTKADEYRIITTTFSSPPGQTGTYKLTVRQYEIQPLVIAGKIDVLPALLHAPKTAATQVVDKLTQAGLPLYVSGFLQDDKGKPVSGKPVQFRWEKGQSELKTDETGAVRLRLSKQNIRNLLLEVPEGLKFALELTDSAGNPVPQITDSPPAKESVKSAGGKLVLEEKAQLTEKDPSDKIRADMRKRNVTKACYYKVTTFKMTGGTTYTLDLQSTDFDAYLRLEDPNSKHVAEDDDGAGDFNSRIVFTPENDGIYRIIVTTCDPDQYGSYRLAVYQAEAKKSDKGENSPP